MTIEIIFLALVSTVRPTSMAALYALLSTASPRRLLTIYIVAGLTFTVSFGLLVIWAFNGIRINAGTDQTKGIAEIAGGIVMLIFAVCALTGRIGGPHAEEAPKPRGRWGRLFEHRLTARTAAVAGPTTHIPGLFYLVALNVIVAHQPKMLVGLVEVLIYNAIWFAIPIGALAVCIVAPATARDGVGALEQWTRLNSRLIVIVVSFAIGGALLIRGVLAV